MRACVCVDLVRNAGLCLMGEWWCRGQARIRRGNCLEGGEEGKRKVGG